jgi:hypothetical protein
MTGSAIPSSELMLNGSRIFPVRYDHLTESKDRPEFNRPRHFAAAPIKRNFGYAAVYNRFALLWPTHALAHLDDKEVPQHKGFPSRQRDDPRVALPLLVDVAKRKWKRAIDSSKRNTYVLASGRAL